MTVGRWTYNLILLLLLAGMTHNGMLGQLSPGPLTQSHSDLEGMSNCTQCHDAGQKVPDFKCLECHDIIKDLIASSRGYHASQEVKSQECIDCHSEHHGRKFDMVRFDQDAFDHNLTGYKLEGEHARIDCKACHTSENIANQDIKERTNTFLGLEHDCVSCHDDYHQKTLGTDCASCHNFETFRPASLFDHDDTAYPLKGAHSNVDCEKCHAITSRNGMEFQQFSDIQFADCVSCHDDPHGKLPGNCSSCHSVSSFDNMSGIRSFNHNLTSFNLKGSHRDVDCFSCHQQNSDPRKLFGDRQGVVESDCVSCHDDVHEGKFGTDCSSCHNEISFLQLNEGFEFDHSVTDFALEGLHQQVDCRDCHDGSFRDPMEHDRCLDCHDDYHEGQFVVDNQNRDCNSCHSVFDQFTTTSFGFAEHEETEFPLEGAHMATPCFACHLSEEKWEFANIGHSCVDCHDDIHAEFISSNYYPEQDCKSCHNSELWSDVSFDHDLTEWPLDGKHLGISCRSCHFEENSDGSFVQNFNNLETSCNHCHENVHGSQFVIEGVTDCKRCHTTQGWGAEDFDHSNTAFPLEGKHAEVECAACHDIINDGVRVFTIEKFECIDCHL